MNILWKWTSENSMNTKLQEWLRRPNPATKFIQRGTAAAMKPSSRHWEFQSAWFWFFLPSVIRSNDWLMWRKMSDFLFSKLLSYHKRKPANICIGIAKIILKCNRKTSSCMLRMWIAGYNSKSKFNCNQYFPGSHPLLRLFENLYLVVNSISVYYFHIKVK